ncbi:unnamed protein product [marine sediment metagenome]|uniref:Uncharacterized protein n=1 Tax=marine sediment metagenome TaxID=412755 RepID=X0RN28_9ZZZZ
MPVEDINAERLATDFLNIAKSSEVTTEFWKNNSSLLAMVLFAILFIGILLAIVVFVRYGIKKALKQ